MMSTKHIFTGLLIGALALVTQCVVANATTVTQIDSINLTSAQVSFSLVNEKGVVVTDTNNGPITTPQPLTFNLFNTGLGNLTGVSITFVTAVSANSTVNAINGDDGTIDFFADGTVDHSLSGVLISTQSLSQTFSADCSIGNGKNCNAVGSNNGNFNGTAGLAAPLTSFLGPGTFVLTATLKSALAPRIVPDNGTSFADNSTIDGTLDASWNGNVTVVYTYDARATGVPEPLSLYLLVAGGGAIALLRRRRR